MKLLNHTKLKNSLLIIFGVIAAIIILILILQNFPITNNSDEFKKKIMSNPEIKAAPDCNIVSYCNDMAAVNCHAEVDGPFFYVNKNSGEILEYCGGYCMGGPKEGKYCINCPPKDWDC